MSTPATPTASFQWSDFDYQMMALALRMAKKGQYTARPNPMVGSVLTQGNQIVGEGWHQKSGRAHAEVNALEMAGDLAKGATCYVTLEPCAHTGKTGPCAQALAEAGVTKVISAMRDPNPLVAGKGFDILQKAGIEVEYGLLEQQAMALNPGFISAMQRKRPWVTCKLAMSLDGRTALADGSSKWITGAAARADVQKLRARQDAIITGIGTVLADNPSLNIRMEDTAPELDDWFERVSKLGFEQPARVLLDRLGLAARDSKIFNAGGEVYWFTDKPLDISESHIQIKKSSDDLEGLLYALNSCGMNNVLIEAGHKLAGEFLQAGLIDELVIYQAPKLMGDQGKGLFELNIESMSDVHNLKLTDLTQIGSDIRLTLQLS
ncbi:MAG: bifunctional diaminohydroxyphosphoribosylaminopyrimidine deaminase/5-amino-6-(5-phosphoribosylamino)uracil reductase RibD [Kangiellaceae bacterium]|nr:bifunctional diaminohydroxyphosphoribosylaminopyrimidine deaminase/5-amino-6-(5-phosphoribosylamino)uracil reductase RibD [Kangiellaceae bacterium]